MGVGKRGIWGIVILAIFLISLYFDKYIVKGFLAIRFGLLTDIFLGLTTSTAVIAIFFVFGSVVLFQKQHQKWIMPLWVTLALSGIVAFILKFLIGRGRPYQQALISTFPILTSTSHFAWNMSFPSFQAMMAFCALPILLRKRPKFKLIWLILAILVALSRVYLGLHFLSDVIAGAVIGYVIGLGVIKFEEKYSIIKHNHKIILKKFKRK